MTALHIVQLVLASMSTLATLVCVLLFILLGPSPRRIMVLWTAFFVTGLQWGMLP